MLCEETHQDFLIVNRPRPESTHCIKVSENVVPPFLYRREFSSPKPGGQFPLSLVGRGKGKSGRDADPILVGSDKDKRDSLNENSLI
jgi:hypothetical protein